MPEWLWALAIGGVLLGLIGVIWRGLERRLDKHEQWQADKERFDYNFRHNEYAPKIAGINEKLWPLASDVEAIDGRVKRIERTLNGRLHESDR